MKNSMGTSCGRLLRPLGHRGVDAIYVDAFFASFPASRLGCGWLRRGTSEEPIVQEI
jgi:hypothetical protein